MLDMPRPALLVATLVIVCLAAHPVTAQVAEVTTPPPNLLVPNYDTVPVGPFGGLEGTAYVARVGDPSAAWFNPAGLVRLARFLRRERIDIIHAHLFEPSVVGLLAGTLAGTPIRVLTRHYSDYHTRIGKKLHVRLDQLGQVADDAVAQVDLVRRLRRPAVDRDHAVLDQLLHERARILGDALVDVDVEPLEDGLLVDLELVAFDALVVDSDGFGHGGGL